MKIARINIDIVCRYKISFR